MASNRSHSRASFITVRVGRLPGRVDNYVLNGDRTVRAALAAADLPAEENTVRVNGSAASLSTKLRNGDNVFVVTPVQGN
jgi:sulfur carrier protein ThiS